MVKCAATRLPGSTGTASVMPPVRTTHPASRVTPRAPKVLAANASASAGCPSTAEPVAVAVIVDRKTGAQAAVEAAGLTWLAAIDLDDLGLQPQ